MPYKRRRHVRILVTALVLAGLLAGISALALRPAAPPPTVGMVRTTEVKIEPEVSGRVAALPVRAGDRVAAGTIVAELSNPELAAAVEEARATVAEARAARDRVYAGVRQEEVDIAAGEVDKAKADLTLAQQQFARIAALASHGNAPLQDLDNARAALARAQDNVHASQSRYAEARRGPTAEDRQFADATVAAARASLEVLERRMDKLKLLSPVDGVVEVVVAELGEAEVPGRTVLTVAAVEQPWFNFNIREDELHGLDIGAPLALTEAATGRSITARVSEMRRLGDFATWRAARAVGDHDLNTFAVRADPVGQVNGLEPGMTVWISAKQ
jgi:multidrug resistance efflux pump